jgi:Flp pilus assembly pilin Flp
MRSLVRRHRLDSAGATAIEYAMVAFFISIAAFSVLVTVGSSVSGLFQQVAAGF